MDDGQVCQSNEMILGRELFSKLNIDLCSSDNNTRGNVGTYEGCNSPMKDGSKMIFNLSSNWFQYLRFWSTELYESKHLPEVTKFTRCVLDAYYEKSYQRKFGSENEHLSE